MPNFETVDWLVIQSIPKTWLLRVVHIFCIILLDANFHVFHDYFLAWFIAMVQIRHEDIMLARKTFFHLNTFNLPEYSFVSKMLDLLQLLISQVKSQYLVY